MTHIRDGIVLVDKPTGCTSFDLVRQLKRSWGIKKIGHAGTLDPLASGLMVILLGSYTKASNFLLMEDKSYQARIVLGANTTTDDRLGEVIAHQIMQNFPQAQIEEVLAQFLGPQEQIPPAFSAIKMNGERCYKKARRGEIVEMLSRRVVFHELKLINYSFPFIDVIVKCSKGTYIRSLARDLGVALGGLAHLGELKRLSSGFLKLENAWPLEELKSGQKTEHILSGPNLFVGVPKFSLTHAQFLNIVQGKAIDVGDFEYHSSAEEQIIFHYADTVIGTGIINDGKLYPKKIWRSTL